MGKPSAKWSLTPAGAAVGLLLCVVFFLAAGDRVRGLLAVSVTLGGGAALIATPLGALLALLLVKTDAPLRSLALLVLGGMTLAPLYLHAAAWRAGFGLLGWATQAAAGDGPIDPLLAGMPGAVWVHAMAATPWSVFIIGAAVRGVSASHEEAAELETSTAGVLRRVTLRRAAAGVAIAALWTVLWCAAEMTVTDLFGVRTFAEEVYTQAALGAFENGPPIDARGMAWGMACGVALLVIAATTVLAAGSRWLLDPNDHEPGGRWRWRLGRAKPIAAAAILLLLALVAALPIANLIQKVGVDVQRVDDGWRRGWSASKLTRMVAAAPWEHRRELLPSLTLAAVVATTTTLLGAAVAWRGRDSRVWRRVAAPLLAACLVVPGPLVGIGAIRLLNQPADSAFAGLTWLYDRTWFAPWLVQTLRAAPLITLVCWPALASVPLELLDSARADGASRWGTLMRVAAPMRWPALAAAWVVGFAVSLGELAATLIVLPPGPQTVTARVFSLLHYGVEDRVAALCLLLIGGYVVLGGVAIRLFEAGTAIRSPRS